MPKHKKRTADYFYSKPDKFILFNDDVDLEPIKVYLPIPPEPELIEGYGKCHQYQKFVRAEMPQKLVELQKNCNSIDNVWDTLDRQRLKYKDEINWIKLQWHRRLNGYWIYINGKPTYICGWHYFYLNFFKIDIGYPEYRDADRKFFIFAEFCYNDTYTFKEYRYDEKGKKIPNRFGDEMVDLGRRVCAGFVFPKPRRTGATYKAQSIGLEIMSRTMNANSGIQSKSDKDGEEVYRTKLLAPFLNLPFFFRPMQKGKIDTMTELSFDAPIDRVKGGALNFELGLGSTMSYRSSEEQAYDGFKLHYFHEDELGKSFKIDILKRHFIVKECLAEKNGYEMIGFGIGTTTVGEMSAGGGQRFLELCNLSDYYDRTEAGLTSSYFYLMFLSAEEGILVDEFGNSKKEESRLFVEQQCNKHLESGNIEAWAEEKRKYPLSFSDCFIMSGGGIGFDTYIIEKRISELRFSRERARYGNFKRENENDLLSKVYFEDDPNGRFCVSLVLTPDKANNYARINGQYRPLKDLFNAGFDPFKFGQGQGKGLSDGGIAVKYRRDLSVDPIDKPIELWESDRFVCTYRYRQPSVEEFCADCLLVAQYYGAYANPETNVSAVLDYFNRNGFSGMLKYQKDKFGHFKKQAGVYLGEAEKQDSFNLHRDYIKRRGSYERHLDYLLECKSITEPSELTKYDLLAAGGVALLGESINYDEIFGKKLSENTTISVIRRKNYSQRRY